MPDGQDGSIPACVYPHFHGSLNMMPFGQKVNGKTTEAPPPQGSPACQSNDSGIMPPHYGNCPNRPAGVVHPQTNSPGKLGAIPFPTQDVGHLEHDALRAKSQRQNHRGSSHYQRSPACQSNDSGIMPPHYGNCPNRPAGVVHPQTNSPGKLGAIPFPTQDVGHLVHRLQRLEGHELPGARGPRLRHVRLS